MIDDVISNLDFLHSTLKFDSLKLQTKNVLFNASGNTCYVSDWVSLLSLEEERVLDQSSISLNPDESLRKELYQLGFVALELWGVDQQEWEDLPNIKGERAYNGALEGIIQLLKELNQPIEN